MTEMTFLHLSDDSTSKATIGCPLELGYAIFFIGSNGTPHCCDTLALSVGFRLVQHSVRCDRGLDMRDTSRGSDRLLPKS